jgi:hypothetical protein
MANKLAERTTVWAALVFTVPVPFVVASWTQDWTWHVWGQVLGVWYCASLNAYFYGRWIRNVTRTQ